MVIHYIISQLKITMESHSMNGEREEGALGENGNGSRLGAVSIRSDRYTYSMVPVQDGIFIVLIQGGDGIPSKGLKVLKESIPGIVKLI